MTSASHLLHLIYLFKVKSPRYGPGGGALFFGGAVTFVFSRLIKLFGRVKAFASAASVSDFRLYQFLVPAFCRLSQRAVCVGEANSRLLNFTLTYSVCTIQTPCCVWSQN